MRIPFMASLLSAHESIIQQTVIVRPDRTGRCEDTWDELCLVRTYRLLGVPVFRRVVDRETIPAYAIIEKATLGFTDWTSQKFFAKINEQNARQHAAAGFIA